MFHIRVLSAPVALAMDAPTAVAELIVDSVRTVFPLDLNHWRVEDYQRQWKAGIARMLAGAPSTALMAAYRGRDAASHAMWALWREEGHVYVQPQSVAANDLATPFDADTPYEHVGTRVPVHELALPIPEWRVDVEHVYANALQLRWPFA